MNSRWRGNDGPWRGIVALLALLALLGRSRGVESEIRRASRSARREARAGRRGGGGLVGLIVGVVVVMALLGLLGNLGALLTGIVPVLALCLIPGALLVFVGLAARSAQRAKEGREAGPAQTAEWAPEAAQAPQSTAVPAAAPIPPAARTAAVPQPPPVTAKAPVQQAVRKPIAEPVRNPADYRQRAIGYRRRLQSLIKSRRRGPLSELMSAILPKLEGWEERVGQLADRLANVETDRLIQRDIKEVPANIQRMQALWEAETDPATRQQIERTLGGYQEQQTQLAALSRLMRRTRFVLDDTLAAMGTIYSQVQVLDAMDIDSTRAAQIGDEIQEQVDRLNDVLSAYSDVNTAVAENEMDTAARRSRLEQGQAAGG